MQNVETTVHILGSVLIEESQVIAGYVRGKLQTRTVCGTTVITLCYSVKLFIAEYTW